MDYLYHYTSLDTLALILEYRKLKLNNLLYVDDIDEAASEDMGNYGKHFYVSCWTEDEEESIPLWNMYTKNMHGVRIGLPKFPFKQFSYRRGDSFFSEDTVSYLNYNDPVFKRCSATAGGVQLIRVEYVDENEKICPSVKKENYEGAAKDYIMAESMNEISLKECKINYSFDEMGKYKRKCWAFQREWRYKVSVAPMGISEMYPPSFKKQQELIRRMEDLASEPVTDSFFLDINDDALEHMDIVLGPKMSQGERILARALLDKYVPNCVCKDSKLRIR